MLQTVRHFTPDNQALFRQLSWNSKEALALVTSDGVVRWVNRAFQKCVGRENDCFKEHHWSNILSDDVAHDSNRDAIDVALASSSPSCQDLNCERSNGQIFLAHLQLEPFQSESGDRWSLLRLKDVTDELFVEQQLTDFSAYRKALDQQAIVSVADRAGKITLVNQKFCDISGFSEQQLVGNTHRVVNSGFHKPSFFKAMWKTIATGKVWRGEVCNRRRSGETYWVDTTIVPVCDQNGDVSRYVSIRYDITERKVSEERLRCLSQTDALTGLANRTVLHEQITEAVARLKRSPTDRKAALLMIDLDHFKDINDTRGHFLGDIVLKKLAERMNTIAGDGATIARLGGDEFAVLISVDRETASYIEMAKIFHDSLSQPLELGDWSYSPSFSIGVHVFGADEQDAEAVLMAADIALNEAKYLGRNCVELHGPELTKKLRIREDIKEVLKAAVDAQNVTFRLQPLAYAESRKHHGFEVLMRLTGLGANLSPEEFIPVAEEFGIIVELERILFKNAFRTHRALRCMGFNPGRFALNCSPHQLRNPTFFEDFTVLMNQFDMRPEYLMIEVTETALIGRHVQTVSNSLTRLRGYGVGIALDDFGTGFSSLSHLRDYSVDKIKIDKTFIDGVATDPNEERLVSSLIRLGKELNLTVVAEGVETQRQEDILKQSDCDLLQGHHISRPLKLDEAIHYMRSAGKQVV